MTDAIRQTKSLTAEVAKSGNGFVLSTTGLDRDNDRIELDALKNAIKGKPKLLALWQHKTDQPIGFWDNLRIDGQKLLGDLKLAGTNLGLMVKELLDFGTPLGASVGFMGKGVFDEERMGINWEEIELLETSVVSCPANPEAMQIAKNFGYDAKSLGVDLNVATSGLTPCPDMDIIKAAKAAVERADFVRKLRS